MMRRIRQGFDWVVMVVSCAVGGALAGSAAGVEVGDPLEQVISELGRPLATIRLNEVEVFYFEGGSVEVTRGQVTAADLVSAEEATGRRRLGEDRAAVDQSVRADRYERGKQELERRLTDAAFLASPAAERVAGWESLKRRYPEVPLPEDYYDALRERSLEREARHTQQRIEQLERRVLEAEARAAELRVVAAVSPVVYVGGAVSASYRYVYPGSVVAVGSADCVRPAWTIRRPLRTNVSSLHLERSVRRYGSSVSSCSIGPRKVSYGYQEPVCRPTVRHHRRVYPSASFRASRHIGVRHPSARLGGACR